MWEKGNSYSNPLQTPVIIMWYIIYGLNNTEWEWKPELSKHSSTQLHFSYLPFSYHTTVYLFLALFMLRLQLQLQRASSRRVLAFLLQTGLQGLSSQSTFPRWMGMNGWKEDEEQRNGHPSPVNYRNGSCNALQQNWHTQHTLLIHAIVMCIFISWTTPVRKPDRQKRLKIHGETGGNWFYVGDME